MEFINNSLVHTLVGDFISCFGERIVLELPTIFQMNSLNLGANFMLLLCKHPL